MVRVKERNPAVQKELKFVVDLTVPKDGDLVIPSKFITFLQNNIKLNGVQGNLGDDLTVTEDRAKVTVTTKKRIPKRYLKYLTKKYFKKNGILEYFRVLATSKNTYSVRYLRNRLDEDGEEEK